MLPLYEKYLVASDLNKFWDSSIIYKTKLNLLGTIC